MSNGREELKSFSSHKRKLSENEETTDESPAKKQRRDDRITNVILLVGSGEGAWNNADVLYAKIAFKELGTNVTVIGDAETGFTLNDIDEVSLKKITDNAPHILLVILAHGGIDANGEHFIDRAHDTPLKSNDLFKKLSKIGRPIDVFSTSCYSSTAKHDFLNHMPRDSSYVGLSSLFSLMRIRDISLLFITMTSQGKNAVFLTANHLLYLYLTHVLPNRIESTISNDLWPSLSTLVLDALTAVTTKINYFESIDDITIEHYGMTIEICHVIQQSPSSDKIESLLLDEEMGTLNVLSTKYRGIHFNIGDKVIEAINKSGEVLNKLSDVTINFIADNDQVVQSINLLSLNQSNSKHFQLVNSNCFISFLIKKSNLSTQLPKAMNTHFLEFLKRHNPDAKTTYCAINFVYEMNNGRNIAEEKIDENYIVVGTSDEKKLAPGDTIYLYGDNQKSHFAIYIGMRHYLSLFGTFNNRSGSLLMATLDDMNKCYNLIGWAKIMKLKLSVEDMEECSNKWKQDYTDDMRSASLRRNNCYSIFSSTETSSMSTSNSISSINTFKR